MPQIAGFRGALWETSKVELASVVATPIAQVRERLERGELVRDPTRALYRYHQLFAAGPRTLTRKSIFAAMALAPWQGGLVVPHEVTDAAARAAAVAGVAAAGIHTDAVVAGYRDPAGEVERLFRRPEADKPTLEVTTADGTAHRLWRVSSSEIIGKMRPLFAPKKLYVLDGHARYEGMLAYRDALAAAQEPVMYSSANFGLACLVNLDDPTLATAARHRIARGDAIKRDAVLEAARSQFIIEKLAGAAKDTGKHFAVLADTIAHQPAFVALFAGDPDAYKLTLSPDVNLGLAIHRAVQKYDPIVVDHFLHGVVPAAGVAHETALEPSAVVAAVAAGAALGLITRPLSIEQIAHAADLGALMPFGSTALQPAIARLLAYVVDPDEDVV